MFWPGYQEIPEPKSLDSTRMRLRALLSLVSKSLTMTKDVRSKILDTRKLRNSRINDVLLIGNGPSAGGLTFANVARFQALGGSVAIMNSFYRSPLSRQVTPDYFFIGGPEFWKPIFKNNENLRKEVENYIRNFAPNVTIVQPASVPPLLPEHSKYIFLDPRSAQGLWRSARPDKPWGLPSSIAMVAIATLKFLGHRNILFTGLDSNLASFYYVGQLNNILNFEKGQHFYSDSDSDSDLLELLADETSEN